jgi:NDP-sugar pyrophosphorylase family protein
MIERDVFPFLAKDGQLLGYKMEHSRWYDCGTLERWEKAIQEW